MNEKIIQFLADAGYEGAPDEPVAMQLLRYFEAEYDVNLLPLLEQEWVDEQIEQEFTHEQFKTLRMFIDDAHLSDYDQTLESIESL